ncbi:hypothetical protein [Profundibacter amoris]|uniref:Uncharacterized protein n=1 Tax=Profundibacter amoris TaxID=2171755 RepID=A0A347UGT4_9RHOB|nr:hypothetical protein [Profundibacter amoris]AXX98062.1 hypothetical protein BAR1_09035 [Profundibacter amoris]
MRSNESIFGSDIAKVVEILFQLVEDLKKKTITYNFMSEDDFSRLPVNEMGVAYWKETLDRAHFASCSSIMRTVTWVNAINAAYESENHLSFISSLRALVEFTGDAVHSLGSVSLTLAESNSAIRKMLDGNVNPFFTSKELEDSLIHYTHARKLKKSDNTPETHIAKQTYHYVNELKPNNPKIYEMYKILCGFAHPAAESNAVYMNQLAENDWALVVEPGKSVISTFISDWQKEFANLPILATNHALCTLKILDVIDGNRYGNPFLSDINLSNVPLWNKCILATKL